jgi:hypothetical protein
MKLNPKIYAALINEPIEKQEINGKIVEIHYMNDTPYLLQFASKGRFAVWTSDGSNFKVLIEKKYHEMLNDFYCPEVNGIWISFMSRVGAINRKMSKWFTYPLLLLYLIIAILGTLLFPGNTTEVLIALVVIMIFSRFIQGRIFNRKVMHENRKAQDEIASFLGEDKYAEIVKAQEAHINEYFKFEETESIDEPVENNRNENIEEDKNGSKDH